MRITNITYHSGDGVEEQTIESYTPVLIEEDNSFLVIKGVGFKFTYPKHLIISIEEWDEDFVTQETLEPVEELDEETIKHRGGRTRK